MALDFQMTPKQRMEAIAKLLHRAIQLGHEAAGELDIVDHEQQNRGQYQQLPGTSNQIKGDQSEKGKANRKKYTKGNRSARKEKAGKGV